MRIETIAVHTGRSADPATGAVTPPIHLTTTFEREPDGGYPKGFNYSRSGNPNRESLEQCLAKLEGGSEAAAFSAGSAATMSVLQSLSPGDYIIACDDLYHGTRHLIKLFEPWGISSSFVDMVNIKNLSAEIRKETKLIWVETPSNPLLKIIDLQKVSEAAHNSGAIVVCDNTWATPILQSPFDFGIDLVMHATTKYIGGHSDILGGAIITKESSSFFQKVREIQKSGGAVPSPFECWLTLRGIQTLPLRIRYQSESAMHIAEFLKSHPAVAAIYYPGLIKHPGHSLASVQMKLYGGMISFEVKGGKEDAMKVAAKVKLFTRATSLGGPESLIEHRASVEGPDTKTPQTLLRLSIGLEHYEDLIEDLEEALGY
jgi:cystathionine gamma-synthase